MLEIPPSSERVPRNTSRKVNARIWGNLEERIHYFAENPGEITARLEELDGEWDIERTLEANASTLALVGLGLGSFVDKRFYGIPAVITGFLLQHAVQGWCPPVPVLRRAGFRTPREIEMERYALKFLRGDFDHVTPNRHTLHSAPSERADGVARAVR